MNRIILLVLTLPLVGCAAPSQGAEIEGLQRGLTVYVPFDGKLDPRFSVGSRLVKAGEANYVAGRAGRAVVASQDAVEIPHAGNFNRPVGTLAFWVRPNWKADDTSVNDRIPFGMVNFQFRYQPKERRLTFMTGDVKQEEGYKWDYGAFDDKLMRTWKAGEWHHIAATWDTVSDEKTLWIDGQLVSRRQTDLIRRITPGKSDYFRLNSSDAPGAYDELMTWNRVLKPDEIALLAAQPAQVAQVLGQTLPQPKVEEKWPVEVDIYKVSLDDAEDANQTIVAPGATWVARVPMQRDEKTPWKGTAKFTLLDFWGKVRGEKSVDLSLAAGQKQTIEVPFTLPNERGSFKVALQLPDGDKTWEKDVASVAAWPAATGPVNDDSFFGWHVNAFSPGTIAQAARLGVDWNRDHNMLQYSWWPRVQPEPDSEWNWDYKNHRTRTLENGTRVLGQWFGTPYWATANGKPLPKPTRDPQYPYGAAPDLDAFAKYVGASVKALPEIRQWEIWNEPEVSLFWNGSPEEFGALAQTAVRAARAADPTVTIVAGGFTQSGFRWHEAAAKAGALRGADAISVHLYHKAGAQSEELLDQYSAQVEHWHDLARQYAGRELPIWDTESGSGDTTWLRNYENPKLPAPDLREPQNWRAATISAIQADAVKQSLGVVRAFSYLWNSANSDQYQHTNALDLTNAPKPKTMARAVMDAQLSGAKYVDAVRRDEGRLWANVYQKNDGTSVVLWWAGRGGEGRVRADWPAPLTERIDIMGNARAISGAVEVSDEPNYLPIAAPPAAVLSALRDAKIEVLKQPAALPKPKVGEAGADVPNLPDYVAVTENPAAAFTVDLRPYANMGFFDPKAGDGIGGWADEGPLNSWGEFPTGKQTFYGVPFDIIDPTANDGKSIITLRGKSVTPTLPLQIENIDLGRQRVRNLYFLQAAAWGSAGQIGKYVVHYADGQSVEIPLSIPDNTANWWDGYKKGEASQPVPLRVTQTKSGEPAWRYVRVFEWQNPRRDVPLVSLDFVSNGGAQTPILLGLSGVR